MGLDSEAPTLDAGALQALSLTSYGILAETLTAFIDETRFRVMDAEATQRLKRFYRSLLKRLTSTLSQASRSIEFSPSLPLF